MRSIGIKVLKNQLSKYIKYAGQGESVLVCDRDRVVAVLSAPPSTLAPTAPDALLADAIREGYITPALMGAGVAPSMAAVADPVMTLPDLLVELNADRSER